MISLIWKFSVSRFKKSKKKISKWVYYIKSYLHYIDYQLFLDKPDQPISFSFKRQVVTDSSFNVEWKPGSDNGPKQTFILMYRKQSQADWIEVTIPDSGEALMNYTLSNLSSGTDYEVVLYASNQLGNSTESDMLTIFNKCKYF